MKSTQPCAACGRTMRPKSTKIADHSGTVVYSANGFCSGCYQRGGVAVKPRAENRWQQPCIDCGKSLRPAGALAVDYPGTNKYGAAGRCQQCNRYWRAVAGKRVTPETNEWNTRSLESYLAGRNARLDRAHRIAQARAFAEWRAQQRSTA